METCLGSCTAFGCGLALEPYILIFHALIILPPRLLESQEDSDSRSASYLSWFTGEEARGALSTGGQSGAHAAKDQVRAVCEEARGTEPRAAGVAAKEAGNPRGGRSYLAVHVC